MSNDTTEKNYKAIVNVLNDNKDKEFASRQEKKRLLKRSLDYILNPEGKLLHVNRLFVPANLEELKTWIRECHEQTGHSGRDAMQGSVRNSIDNIGKENSRTLIADIITSCSICRLVSSNLTISRKRKVGHWILEGKEPGTAISMDLKAYPQGSSFRYVLNQGKLAFLSLGRKFFFKDWIIVLHT